NQVSSKSLIYSSILVSHSPRVLNNLMFFIISSNLILTEGLEGFYHLGTIMEQGWKADLSPTLKDHKKK
ncbi:hypothetical protein, partial [Staphylococcus sp. MB377]|uniref:hypothetical protein n=1 Tax=Staphylococcus sp. MB377 TaxID=1663564 RepID=UPI000947B456